MVHLLKYAALILSVTAIALTFYFDNKAQETKVHIASPPIVPTEPSRRTCSREAGLKYLEAESELCKKEGKPDNCILEVEHQEEANKIFYNYKEKCYQQYPN